MPEISISLFSINYYARAFMSKTVRFNVFSTPADKLTKPVFIVDFHAFYGNVLFIVIICQKLTRGLLWSGARDQGGEGGVLRDASLDTTKTTMQIVTIATTTVTHNQFSVRIVGKNPAPLHMLVSVIFMDIDME